MELRRHGKGPWVVAIPLVLSKWLASVHYVVVLFVFDVPIHWALMVLVVCWI